MDVGLNEEDVPTVTLYRRDYWRILLSFGELISRISHTPPFVGSSQSDVSRAEELNEELFRLLGTQ